MAATAAAAAVFLGERRRKGRVLAGVTRVPECVCCGGGGGGGILGERRTEQGSSILAGVTVRQVNNLTTSSGLLSFYITTHDDGCEKTMLRI